MAKTKQKEESWEERQAREDAEARAKGWMPQKPLKGRITKDMIGRVVLTGWLDSPPRAGLIVELHPADYRSLDVFFPESGTVEEVERDQVFGLGERVILREHGANAVGIFKKKLRVSFETGVICDLA